MRGVDGSGAGRADDHAEVSAAMAQVPVPEVTQAPRRRSKLVAAWRRLGIRAKAILITVLVLALATPVGVYAYRDYFWGPRADARDAAQLLKKGELWPLGEILQEYRGDPDFAYFFTSAITPREIGDALGEVAGTAKGQLFKTGVVPSRYELLLADLAGTVSIATFGIDDRALPASWTEEFVMATTTPSDLYGGRSGFFDSHGKARERQDEANRSNLLLLLSRGFWSTDFLQSVTSAFHDLDTRLGAKAWPAAKPSRAKYAPAPEGVYVTDGIVALAAALTANPDAAEWAFVDFLPGKTEVAGTEYSIGRFTHFLLFERSYAEAEDGEPAGVTAVLTALSSAIDSFHWVEEDWEALYNDPGADDWGPMHDVVVLKAIANDMNVDHGCSWHPRDYWNCGVFAAKVVWQWVKSWGHLVLGILTLATFAPPPFKLVGIGAAAINTTWYAIEGDYLSAGLSLAIAVPSLAHAKLARSLRAGGVSGRALQRAEATAQVAKQHRTPVEAFAQRPALRQGTQQQIIAAAPKNSAGHPLDPNTGQVIRLSQRKTWDFGHKPGYEWTCIQQAAAREGWSRAKVIEFSNNPAIYQIELASANRSRIHQGLRCKI